MMNDITPGVIETLRAAVAGSVTLPGDAGYADAVNIWNGGITRRPSVV